MVVVDVIVCCIFSLYFKLMLTVFQIFNHVLVFFLVNLDTSSQ